MARPFMGTPTPCTACLLKDCSQRNLTYYKLTRIFIIGRTVTALSHTGWPKK